MAYNPCTSGGSQLSSQPPTSRPQDLLTDLLTEDDISHFEFKRYSIHDLSDLYLKHCDKINLSVFHVNIRSINKNGENLLDFINTYAGNFDIYVLSEIWSTNIDYFHNLIPGYSLHYVLPVSSRAGGVALYCKNSLTVIPRMDVQVANNQFELLCCDINNNKNNNKFTICGIYRHPGTPVADFISVLTDKLSLLSPTMNCMLIGDLNIDLKHYDTCNSTRFYVDELISRNFLPLVFLPTRVTQTTETIIDHVFMNNIQIQEIKTGLITTDISDHIANFIFLLKPENKHFNDRPKIRIYSEKNFETFHRLLLVQNWDVIYACCDPNIAYMKFYELFYDIFNTSFPLETASRKRMKDKVWLTSALKNSIKTKSQLYKIWLINKTPDNERTYKDYSNKLQQLLRIAKKDYFSGIFNRRCSNIKNMWGQINKYFSSNHNCKKRNGFSEIKHNGINYKDPAAIANAFSDYFANVGKNLAKTITTTKDNFKIYLPNPMPNSFYMSKIEMEEILEVLDNLKPSKTTGPDSLNSFIIKQASSYIASPLHFLFNLSIDKGIFPDSLKVARVVPIHKKGNTSDCSNYRPISLTSNFSKIFEKIICKRLVTYLNKYNLLYDYQFGFRKNFSTSLALMEVINMINTELVNNYVLGIFIDLQKAFDTVNIEILLHKLSNIGIRGTLHNWIKSYLTGRQIFTSIDGCNSSKYDISIGVPQGGALSPLLFLVYINDFHRALIDTRLRLFADDSNAFIISDRLEELFEKANSTLKLIQNWLTANQLTLNASKTSYMIFKLSNRDKEFITFNNLSLKLNGQEVAHVANTKYLGVTINETLTWHEHVNELIRKIRSYNGVFYKYSKFIHYDVAKTLYYSLVYSRITYGLELFGNSRKYVIHPLEVSCNRILRTLQNKPLLYPITCLYENFDTFPMPVLHHIALLKMMHRCIYEPNSIPAVIRHKICFNKNVHNYNTRNANDFHFLTNYVSDDPLSYATHLWNKMPVYIKTCNNYAQFLMLIKHFYRPINK